jgi:hypothetical protein
MTFHQFEHKRWLTRIADDSDYFAVAPRKAGVSTEEKLKWLEQIFLYIQPLDTSNGQPRLRKKVHGLGVSSVDWMERLPFFSVDNTSWLQGARSHARRFSLGDRSIYQTLDQWKRLARECGMPTRYLREMLGYGVPGERPDPKGNSGTYWLMFLAMEADVVTECHITKHWGDRGLILDHGKHSRCTLCWLDHDKNSS